MQHSIADVADVAVMVSTIQVGAVCICGTAGRPCQNVLLPWQIQDLAGCPVFLCLNAPGFCFKAGYFHHSLLCLCNATLLPASGIPVKGCEGLITLA